MTAIKIFLKTATTLCIAVSIAFTQTTQEKTINGIECVLVKAGTFWMGATDGEDGWDDEYPSHQVTLTKDYWVSKYPVTQKQYQTAMGNNPSSAIYGIDDNYPVNMVTWDEAVAFCNKVGGRLLTEAEWEFAARGGNKSKGYIYSGSDDLSEVGWYYENSNSTSHPVGQKIANELGIYDMSGSIYEWVNDWYGGYSSSSVVDPTGPINGSYRVGRGGNRSNDAWNCRVAHRNHGSPSIRYYLGLRVAFNSAATPIRDTQKSGDKHGVLLKENIVSDKAEFEVALPDDKILEVKIVIYDNTGNAVFETSGGKTNVFWNLTNGAGRSVANGSYLIIVEAKGAKGTYTYSAKVGVRR